MVGWADLRMASRERGLMEHEQPSAADPIPPFMISGLEQVRVDGSGRASCLTADPLRRAPDGGQQIALACGFGRRRRHLSGGQSAVERPTRRGIGAAMHWLSCHLGQHLRAREFSGARRRTGCFLSPCSAGSTSKQADHQLLLHTSTRGSAIAYTAIWHQSGTVGFILLALRQLVC